MVNCVDLPNADSGILKSSLSDPTCILYMKDEPRTGSHRIFPIMSQSERSMGLKVNGL